MLLGTSINEHDPDVPLDVLRTELSDPADLTCANPAAHVTGFLRGVPVDYLIIEPTAGTISGDELATLFATKCSSAMARAELEQAAFPTPWPDPDEGPTYSVAICTADRVESLERCLESLRQLSPRCQEIVIVDNSQRQSAEVAALVDRFATSHDGHVVYAREAHPGLDRSRNRALLTASSELVLFTDDDVEITPGWDSWLVSGFRDPLVMAAAGLVLPASLQTSSQIRSEQFCSHSRGFAPITYGAPHRFPSHAPHSQPSTPGVGAAMAVRRQFAQSLGGFPDELDAGMATGTGGDTWMFRSVVARGYRLAYQPRSVARHWHRENPAALTRLFTANSSGVWALNWRQLDHVRRPSSIKPMIHTLEWHRRTVAHTRRDDAGALPKNLLAAEAKGVLGSFGNYLKAKRTSRNRPHVIDQITSPPAPWMEPAPTSDRSDSTNPGHAANLGQAAATAPLLSVCIPTRGRKQWVTELAETMARMPFVNDVVVAVDGDIDGTASSLADLQSRLPNELADKLQWTVLASSSTNPTAGNGAGTARNRAAELAKGDYLLFIDDDVRPGNEDLAFQHLDYHRNHLDTHDAAVVVGPALVDSRSVTTGDEIRGRNWWVDQSGRLATEPQLGFIDLCTANVSLSRSTFDRLGHFPETARREDWHFGLRAEKMNVPLIGAPAAAVIQRTASRSTDRLDRLHDGMGDGAILNEFPGYQAHLPERLRPAGGARRTAASFAGRRPELYLKMEPALHRLAELAPRNSRTRRRLDNLRTTCNFWAGVGLSTEATGNPLLTDQPATAHPEATVELTDATTPDIVATGVPFAVHYRGEQIGITSAYHNNTAFPIWRLRRCLVDRFAGDVAASRQAEPLKAGA